MNEFLTISNEPPEHPSMDYTFLRQEGIRHLERMTGQLWTDFNAHDPGITILEQVCYALTDLAHRINYELPDLLTSAGEQAYNHSLYSPARMLTSHPVTLSDLRKVVIDVEGVKNAWVEKVEAQQIPLYYHASEKALSLQEGEVRNISISAGGTPQAWSLNLDANKAPKLNLDDSDISLVRNQLTATMDVENVKRRYNERLRHSATFHKLVPDERDVPPSPGRDRNVGNYYSLQHQFPATYGIGAMGLPESATPQRVVQAKQLKAYLMFFDQLLANYFSQLAHVTDLFSFSRHTARTYFSQPIDAPSLGLEGIRRSELSDHQGKLQQITENPHAPTDADFRRCNRFLNHLLARFAEQFTDYSLILYGAMPDEGISATEKLVQDKQTFLQDYPQISSARGTAFNYLQPWNSENCSGLEKRLQRKLGIVDAAERFYVVEHILLRPMEGDEQQQAPLLTNAQRADPYSLQLSFVFPDWPPRFKNPGFRAFIERTIREETLAHLIPYIHWLDQPAMAVFKDAYKDWVDKRRTYWRQKLGLRAE